jgi:large subunit ribosomal protein L15
VDLVKLGYNKLLGGGRVTRPMVVRTPWASRLAEEKLRRAGGSVELIKGVLHA